MFRHIRKIVFTCTMRPPRSSFFSMSKKSVKHTTMWDSGKTFARTTVIYTKMFLYFIG